MSVEVEHFQPRFDFHVDNLHRPNNMMNGMTGSICLSQSACSLASIKVEQHAARIKTQISRSREASPCEVRLGFGHFSNTSSPKLLQKSRVKGINSSSVSVTTSSSLLKTETVSKSISSSCQTNNTICDKLKKLNIGSQSLNGLCPEEVASRLEKSTTDACPLLLDCRPFIAFNMVHIRDALSLNCCDRITKKRLLCGKIQIVDIISGEEGKNKFRQHKDSSEIIVYDEETEDLEKQDKCGSPSSLKLVATKLQTEGYKVFYMKGGLRTFQKDHSDRCYKPEYKPPPKLLYSPTTPAVIDDQIDAAVISEILPFLFIGNERDVANLELMKEHGITHVLNVTSHIPLHFESQGIVYKRLPASDSGSQNLKQYFDEAFAFIDDIRQSGGKVLVHCQAGVSRSATITISYIMKHMSMSMMEAFHFVKSKRSIVSPNFNFMGQLYELEQLIYGNKTPNHLGPPVPFELQMHCSGKI